MIQLHQSDWIMISMWVASAWSFLSLPAIIFQPPPPPPTPHPHPPTSPRFLFADLLFPLCTVVNSYFFIHTCIIKCSPLLDNGVFTKLEKKQPLFILFH